MSHTVPGTIVSPALVILLAPSCTEQEPQVPPPPSTFIQLVSPEESEKPRLETSVTTYRGPDGQTVDLVAALHIADKRHYEDLQEIFATYDALLYEMVADEGVRPTPGEKSSGILSFFQRGLTNATDLAFQLDSIDYSPDNFVHADLDPESMAELMEERGESILGLLFQAMMSDMSSLSGGDPEAPVSTMSLVDAFRNREGRHHIRMLFARQMTEIERIAAGFGGPDGESVLVEGRNKRALEVFDEQMELGVKKLGIYYGAAHMPDFEERLLARGFVKTGERWLTAWDLVPRADPLPPRLRKKGKE